MIHSFYWLSPGRFQVLIEPRAIKRLEELCTAGWPCETGGILIGHYSPGLETACICEVTPPATDSRRGRTWLVRGVSGLAAKLERLWQARPRQHYLGEWHLHPSASPTPSRQDIRQMQEIAGAPECAVPILLLVGGSPESGFRLGLYVFEKGQEPRRLTEAPVA